PPILTLFPYTTLFRSKHNGEFDIPVERLWDDDLPNGVRGQKWFNPDDFAKGLAIAQARHPKPPPRLASPPSPVETLLEPSTTTADRKSTRLNSSHQIT